MRTEELYSRAVEIIDRIINGDSEMFDELKMLEEKNLISTLKEDIILYLSDDDISLSERCMLYKAFLILGGNPIKVLTRRNPGNKIVKLLEEDYNLSTEKMLKICKILSD